MRPQALGYVGIRAKNTEDWAGYGRNLLGLQLVDQGRASLAFRMDDRKQRIMIDADGGEGIAFFGWEVADAAALDAFAGRLEASGIKFARGSRALADERRVADLIVLNDPVGHRLEIFHGAEVTREPFRPGRNISGFRTGPLGLGHVVLQVERLEDAMAFYRDVLGFRVSDYFLRPYPVYFFHVNPRHHSLAFAATGKNAVHHMMLELYSLDDVGQGYDLANAEEGRLAVSLGRHCGDWVTSFYTWTPSAFMVEYGWGARDIDVDNWQPSERKEGPSLWGHERAWMAPEQRREAREMRIANAQAGLRRPVQVLEGNFDVMTGVCPWFDSVKGRQKRA
ncbi:MAG TPA: VOC family protein [Xanthobacteraceae bacterium]|nr:VOC family protein [Xanthobacteraceae bacterium]